MNDGVPILEAHGVTLRFGGVTALEEVDFEIERGSLFSIIGPNGAGKTHVTLHFRLPANFHR